jgi:hypothetical protein
MAPDAIQISSSLITKTTGGAQTAKIIDGPSSCTIIGCRCWPAGALPQMMICKHGRLTNQMSISRAHPIGPAGRVKRRPVIMIERHHGNGLDSELGAHFAGRRLVVIFLFACRTRRARIERASSAAEALK